MHDALGHHAADGALAMALASIVESPQRNAFYTSMRSTQDALAGKPTAPPGASLTDPDANVSTCTQYSERRLAIGVALVQLADFLFSDACPGVCGIYLALRNPCLTLISHRSAHSHSRWTHSTHRRGQQIREKFSGRKRSPKLTQTSALDQRLGCKSIGLHDKWSLVALSMGRMV